MKRGVTASVQGPNGPVGARSGQPTSMLAPEYAAPSVPTPLAARSGPVCPNRQLDAITSRGFSALSCAHPSPMRSSVPAVKLSITTSTLRTRVRTMSRPAGAFRSSVRLRLPALMFWYDSDCSRCGCPLRYGPSVRRGSTRRELSTLITSAPRSAR